MNMPSDLNLRETLQHHVVNVQFIKADGSLRTMMATLMEKHLPVRSDDTQQVLTSDPNLYKVWDLQAQAWRSFRQERIQSWQVME